jgi:hypothetical protein
MSILTAIPEAVNFDFAPSIVAEPDDEHRPTAGPDFIPTPEEEAQAAELLNGDDEPDWDTWADDAMALDSVCLGTPWL